MDEAVVKKHIEDVIVKKVSEDHDSRTEALQEFFSVIAPQDADGPISRWCHNIPALLPSLYSKWATMFAGRMLETLPEDQLELLCNNDKENNAALSLAFVMFMESERMEAQVAADLKETSQVLTEGTEKLAMQEAIASAVGARLRRSIPGE